MILATTKTIARLPHLETFMAESRHAVAGWGRKRSGRAAAMLAKMLRRELAILEDGFIHSTVRSSAPLSILVDNVGVYYDASRSSAMEHAIAAGADPSQSERARSLMNLWRTHHISKYNHAPEYKEALPERYVLVADQVFGDLSVRYGNGDMTSFQKMIAAALSENPGVEIIVKIHPDVFARAKRGYLAQLNLRSPRIRIIGTDCHSSRLIQHAQSVYCVTSLVGFEGMLWNKPVRCFGMPFYAGWGISIDDLQPPSRRSKASREDITHAALVKLAKYADPETGKAWEIEDAIDFVTAARAARSTFKVGNFSA